MLLKTTITIQNSEYLDILSMELGAIVELIISTQKTWNTALLISKGNRPNESMYAGVIVQAIDVRSDMNHRCRVRDWAELYW
jgi:hypothetical protein